MKKQLCTALLALLAAAPVHAQGVAGTWIAEFDRAIRNNGGAVSTSEKARAKLVLVQNGDSVTGTWHAMNNAPSGAPARELKGTIAGNKVTLHTQFQATVNINGETETRTLAMTLELTLSGDKLDGTMANKSGDMEMPPRPISAWREGTK